MMDWALLIASVGGTTFSGMLWYYAYQERHKRNNPPSRKGKSDRHLG
ncbi:hypothetical protein ACIFOT_31345 [Neobacillus sp. NRS-1170]